MEGGHMVLQRFEGFYMRCMHNISMIPGEHYKTPERRMLHEYCMTHLGSRPRWIQPRIGPYPKGKPSNMYGVLRFYCDVISMNDVEVEIFEFKITARPEGVGELLLYKMLFSQTPEFTRWQKLPVKLAYIVGRDNEHVRKLCHELGIRYFIFCPEWLKEHLTQRAVKAIRER